MDIGYLDITGSTNCTNCGEILDQTLAGLPEHVWCSRCGSHGRTISIEIREELNAQERLFDEVLSASALTLQTVVIRGAGTSEGAIVEAVTLPWFAIIERITRDPKAMFEIGPRMWEEIIAGAYVKAGWDEVILTPRSGDRGRDVIATKRCFGSVRVIDQVKAYAPGRRVTANDVRALMGILQGDGASKGIVTTTSSFAPRLTQDPLIKPWIPSRLELIDGPLLLASLDNLKTRG